VRAVTAIPSGSPTRSGAGPTDAALVIAARAGETWAQEALFRRHGRMALGLAHRLLPSDPEIEDIVQDSFVFAIQRLAALNNPQAFAAWLGSIIVRTVQKRLRHRRMLTRLGLRRPEQIDPDSVISPQAPPEVAHELTRVYGVLEQLPAEERVALVLRRVDGLEIAEIAERMALSVSTIKRRLAAAEARLERASER
jgi:RNA polymerase sigma-70 factor (ECF subfamily)